jgi:hypothetical protein
MRSTTIKLSKGSQSLYYRELLELSHPDVAHHSAHKLRIEIESNSYDFQCHAWIQRWDGSQWHELEHIHHGNMGTPAKLYYKCGKERDVAPTMREYFESDRDELIEAATAILYGAGTV